MTLDATLDEICAHLHADGINAKRDGAKITVRHPEDRTGRLAERLTAFANATAYYLVWSWGDRLEIVDAETAAKKIAKVVTPDAALQTT